MSKGNKHIPRIGNNKRGPGRKHTTRKRKPIKREPSKLAFAMLGNSVRH